jgi:hypothetical protein
MRIAECIPKGETFFLYNRQSVQYGYSATLKRIEIDST